MRERHGYKNEQKAYIFLNSKVLIEVHLCIQKELHHVRNRLAV